jgi:hypothetical protein
MLAQVPQNQEFGTILFAPTHTISVVMILSGVFIMSRGRVYSRTVRHTFEFYRFKNKLRIVSQTRFGGGHKNDSLKFYNLNTERFVK